MADAERTSPADGGIKIDEVRLRDKTGAYVDFATALSNPGTTYSLANNITLAAGASTLAVTGVNKDAYIWNIAGATGMGGNSLVLEVLDSQAASTNYQTLDTATAVGNRSVVIGKNATVRLRNTGATPITNLSSNLS